MKVDKEFIKKEIKRMDKNLDENDEAFFIAEILLASLKVGANTKKIAKFLEVEEKKIKKYETNLRSNKIWEGNKIDAEEWFDKKLGGVSFWLAVCVAQGYIKKTFNNQVCKKCGHKWISRTESPKACPNCKSRNWK